MTTNACAGWLCLALASGIASADWYSPGWPYRQKIVIDHSAVSGTVAHLDFPALLQVTDSMNPLFGKAQTDGADLLFTAADGTTRLAHEIDEYDATAGKRILAAWVKVPSLSPTSDTELYLYYGNPHAEAQGDPAVWSDYAGVWHLSQEADGTNNAAVYRDSTANANHGKDNVLATGKDGRIGRGQELGETARDFVDVPHSSSLILTSSLTLSAWVRTSGQAVETGGLCSKQGGGTYLYDLYMLGGRVKFGVYATSPGTFTTVEGTLGDGDDGNWHHFAGVADSATATLRIYSDGRPDGSTGYSGGIRTESVSLKIGENVAHQFLNGLVDEVRVCKLARATEWIQTEHANQGSPGAFAAFGSEERDPQSYSTIPWLDPAWKHRLAIKLSPDSIAGALTNFPVLVHTENARLSLWSRAQGGGGDIRFTLFDGQTLLAHELAAYRADAEAERLTAWVKVPVLSSATNTLLWMYYGNPDAPAAGDAEAVWNNGYLAVWHLDEAATNGATHRNAAADALHAARIDPDNSGGGLVAGRIGGGAPFDGANDVLLLASNVRTAGLTGFEAYTVGVWLYKTLAGGIRVIATAQDSGGGVWHLEDDYWWLRTAENGYQFNAYPTLAAGGWIHLCAVYDGSTLRVYRDGALLDADTAQSGIMIDSTVPCNAGARLSGGVYKDFFGGTLDELRISSTARSADWILAEFNNQNRPTQFANLGGEFAYVPPGSVILLR